MPTPSQAEQLAEGQNRQLLSRQGIQATPDELASASEVFDDPARPDPQTIRTPGEPPASDDRAPTLPKPRVDAKRADIVSRFRQHRTEETDDVDQISDFQRSGLPQEFGDPIPDLAPEQTPALAPGEEDEAAARAQAEQAQPPAKRKVKVRGVELEVSEEEYHAAAQKALAADSYLDEAKSKLGEVDELLKSTRNSAQRPSQPGTHPAEQNTAQSGEPDASQTLDPQHPEGDDMLTKAIEAIQYGDPTDARQFLDNAVESKAARVAEAVVTHTLQSRVLQDDIARTQAVLKDFEDQHQDLAKDPKARAAIEATVYEKQVEDLRALGVDPARLPTKTGRVTPADIADAHRYYRLQGFKVRPPGEILSASAEEFLEWRGTPSGERKADPNPQPLLPPRVEVRVDREQRRAAVQQQPSRSAIPRQQPQQVAQPRDRSDVVLAMKQARAKAKGQIAV